MIPPSPTGDCPYFSWPPGPDTHRVCPSSKGSTAQEGPQSRAGHTWAPSPAVLPGPSRRKRYSPFLALPCIRASAPEGMGTSHLRSQGHDCSPKWQGCVTVTVTQRGRGLGEGSWCFSLGLKSPWRMGHRLGALWSLQSNGSESAWGSRVQGQCPGC
jgi:hypothetical protein